jgi:hypothetical protein
MLVACWNVRNRSSLVARERHLRRCEAGIGQ